MNYFFNPIKSIFGVILTVTFFVFSQTAWSETVSNLRITNVRGNQFTVSYTVDSDVVGQVRYGTSTAETAKWVTADDDRENVSDEIHHVTIIK